MIGAIVGVVLVVLFIRWTRNLMAHSTDPAARAAAARFDAEVANLKAALARLFRSVRP